MTQTARAIAESARFAPTLSLDDPTNRFNHWRWFVACGWQSSALMLAQDLPALAPRTPTLEPEPEATS
jgi:hypothetical protein